MKKISFDEYDNVSSMERTIEILTKSECFRNSYIVYTEREEQIIFIITIISILYKHKCYQEYLEKITEAKNDVEIEILDNMIEELHKCVKEDNYIEASKIIKNNEIVIQEFLTQYYTKKDTNYITNKHTIEVVIKEKKQKEILKYNPLIINQLLKAKQTPLTEEEQIIEDILEFIVESEQICFTRIEISNNIKKLMEKKYKEKELDNVISFIISIIYQEIKENPISEISNMIIAIVENEKISKEEILKRFKEDEKFSNIILKTFQEYNFEIEEGKLRNLEQQPSKEYAKRIYNKIKP